MPTDPDLAAELDSFDGGPDELIDDPTLDPPLEPIRGEDDARRFHRWRHRDQRALDRLETERQAELDRVHLFFDDRTAGLRRQIDRLDGMIERWHRASGTARLRTRWYTSKINPPRAHVDVLDRDLFVAWAMRNGRSDLLKIEPAAGAVGKLPTVRLTGAMPDSQGVFCDAEAFTVTQPLVTGETLTLTVPGVLRLTPAEGSFTIPPVKETEDDR